jgi:putative oxidoreductase
MSWLGHPWLTVRVQIALGAIFIAAALPKIVDPPSFAQMIYNYRIVPGWAVNPLALVLPWIEITAGLALVLGVMRRAAASIIGAMLIVFIIGIGINLARNNPIDCGCFAQNPVPKTNEQLFTDMRWVIIRDIGMLAMVAQILWAAGAERRGREESIALAARASHVAARS